MKRILSLWLMTFLFTVASWASFTPALFSIADGKQVYFSPGNLQCTGVTSGNYTWAFAENQYDMLGTANVSGSSLADKIDLFGWSGSIGTAKWGIGTYQNNDYYKGNFVDWGQNAIGTYEPNTYRTLTKDEWTYLLNTRTDADKKKGVARINLTTDGSQYVNGLILLPDNCSTGITFNNGYESTSSVDAYATHNTYTIAQWQQLEAQGAVFLPAAGRRHGTGVASVQSAALYWSSTPNGAYNAYYLYFNSKENSIPENIRYRGNAVRLVEDLRFAIAITTLQYGSVVPDKTKCAAGGKVTLTVTPDTGYELNELTVKDANGETVEVTNNAFTMPAGAVTVTATFKKKTYDITINECTNGKVESSAPTAQMGDKVTLTVTPDAYYALKSLTVLQGTTAVQTTAVAGTTNQYTFTMPAGNVSITAEFEKLASAFTPSLFTIAVGKQVYFSSGNLQCAGLTRNDTTWSFAEYQTDMLGTDNVSGGTEEYSESYAYKKTGTALADKIDLFGWSGSTGTAKWGIATSKTGSDYAGNFVDWGQNIGDGTTYRTLTKNEWYYLLYTRTDADSKKGVARINLTTDGSQYVNGLILLPDTWNCPKGVTFNSGYESTYSIEAYATHNSYTLTQWQQLESAGAVFLPAAGYRDGSSASVVQRCGYYWSATASTANNNAYLLNFQSSGATTSYDYIRVSGRSVRLVQDRRYAIAVVPSENGTVVPDRTEGITGNYIRLTITPDAGYELESLTVKDAANNSLTLYNNNRMFVMPASAVTIHATFKKATYAITIKESDNGEVKANVATAQMGDVVTLTITPATDYELNELTVKDANGKKVEVANNAFTMPASAVTVTASFKKKTYDITINECTNGKVEPSVETAQMGDDVTLTITPDTGYELAELTVADAEGQTVALSADHTFTMPASAVTVTATFKKKTYNITINASENGKVESSVATAQMGDVVTLTITPATGYELAELTVADAEGQKVEVANNAFTMPASAVTVTATFKKVNYDITINASENGKVESPVATAQMGDKVTLTVTPATGYELNELTVADANGETVEVTNNAFTMPASAVTVTASFKKKTYNITINASTNGKVESSVATAQMGDKVTLTITPDTGYELAELTVKDADGETVEVTNNAFTMPASAVTVTATFKKKTFTITTQATNGDVTGGGTYDYGTEVKLTATAHAHYHFVQWNDGNTNATRTIIVTDNATYTAEFAIDQHTITVTAVNGDVTGGGTYDYGTEVKLTATAHAHYHFVKWNDGNTNATRTITVTDNATYTAEFAIDQHTITVTAVNGDVTGDGTYAYGTTVKLEAKHDKGYVFSQWSDGTKENPYEFVVTANITLEAVFVPEVPTEIDATQGAAGDSVRKVLIDGKVYILRNGKVYTPTGATCTLPAADERAQKDE